MRLGLRLLPAMVAAVLLTVGTPTVPAQAQPPTPPAPPPDVIACEAAYQIDSSWGNGFMSSVTVTNVGTVPVGWRVVVTFTGSTVTQGWNGTFSIGRQSVIIDPPSWLPALEPRTSHTAGMIGTGTGVPDSVTVTCWRA